MSGCSKATDWYCVHKEKVLCSAHGTGLAERSLGICVIALGGRYHDHKFDSNTTI